MALPAPPSVTINPVVSSVVPPEHLSISIQDAVPMTNGHHQLILGVMVYNYVGVMRTVATTILSQIVAKLRLLFSP